ncbi:glutamate-rich protein 2 isoform X2 [Notamacropus eugenii]|uniref:glutamate-rich protein 2 isoform X2 n=1 Tax=Notamacropus eugenii TaxID=9315 RepID=UPI003B6787D9
MSRYAPRCSGTSRTVLSKAPRMLEVIGPEGEVFLEADFTISGRNCLDRPDITKEPNNRHYGKLQVLDPNEVVIEPVEAMSRKILLGNRRELTSKSYMATTKSSLNIVKISSEKKKISSKSSENKDLFTNSNNKLWSSSSLQEKTDSPAPNFSASMETTSQNAPYCDSPGDTGQDTAVAKINEDSSQRPDDRLSETIEGDEEDRYNNDKYVGENAAPLELMTEFLRAVMSRKYAVAKKLCQLILIYEPENPEAKQFSSLIEEKLLMEKSHAGEEDDDDDEEEEEEEESDDSSDDSEEDSSDDNDQSEDSSDESEDI